MKEAFIKKRFYAGSLAMIPKINAILEYYSEQGLEIGLRGLHYKLVKDNVIPNTIKSYKNLSNLLSDARLAGLVDWNHVRDFERVPEANGHCEDETKVIQRAKYGFSVDMWKRQDHYVEVMVEKRVLQGVLSPTCAKWDVPFNFNKGYSSSSAFYEASKRYIEAAEAGKELHVIYLGDHDPSGVHMTEDVHNRFHRFINTTMYQIAPTEDDAELFSLESRHRVHRIALNMDQVEKYHLPENPTKQKDSRTPDYIRKFGKSCWELDAIDPLELIALTETAIKRLINFDIWEEDKQREEKARQEIHEFALTFRDETWLEKGKSEPQPPSPEPKINIHDYTQEERE